MGNEGMLPAVILAGGRGTRLRPLTERLPKPLVPVRGRPFVEHQLRWLRAEGVREALLLVSYRGKQIEKALGDGTGVGVRLRYVYEETPRGTGGALTNAAAELPEEFFLVNGDTYMEASCRRLLAAYHATECVALLAAFENREDLLANNLKVGPDGRVEAYSKSNPAGLTHVDAGLGVFHRRVVEWIPRERVVSLEEEIYPRLIAAGALRAHGVREPFFDMGSFAGLRALEAKLSGVPRGDERLSGERGGAFREAWQRQTSEEVKFR